MKSFFLIVGLLLLEPQSHSKVNFDGGMSGGGGFIINPAINIQANDLHHLEKIIRVSAGPVLKNYFSKKLQIVHSGDLPESQRLLFERLFTNEVSIFDAIEDKKNAICLSAVNIAKKVVQKDLRQQSIALMVHEYSEVVGMTDDEATDLQKIVLTELNDDY